MDKQTKYLGLSRQPNMRKFLDMLSASEGTTKHGYFTMFGGTRLNSLRDHPRYTVPFTQKDGKKNASSAAGRYQFVQKTWTGVANALGLKDFSPRSQEIAAVYLIKRRGALKDVLQGNWDAAIKKTGKEWASLYTAPKKYQQHTRSKQFIMKHLQGGKTQAQQSLIPDEKLAKILQFKLQKQRQQRAKQQQIKQQKTPQLSDAQLARMIQGKLAARKNAANKTWGDRMLSRGKSAAMGLAELGGGIVQGVAYAGDAVNKHVVNPLLGTNLEENAYEKYNQQMENAKKSTQSSFVNSGRGTHDEAKTDLWKTGTQMVAAAPLMPVKGLQGAKLASRAGAAFLGKNAAAGAAVGGLMYAPDSASRLSSVAAGAAGGAVGAGVAEKVLAPAMNKTLTAVAKRTPKAKQRALVRATQVANTQVSRATAGMDLPPDVISRMQVQARDAIIKGRKIDDATLKRSALLGKHGLQGTKAQMSGKPRDWQQEVALSKKQEIGDPILEKYGDDIDQIHQLKDSFIDDVGGRPADTFEVGDEVKQSFAADDAAARQNINELYDFAKNATGNDTQLNGLRFVNETSLELEKEGLGSYLKGDVRNIMQGLFDGKGAGQFSLAKGQEAIKIINRRMGNTADPAERYAFGVVKRNLEKEMNTTLDDVAEQIASGNYIGKGNAEDAKAALANWQDARQAAKARFDNIEQMPVYKSVVKDNEPDKFFDKFVLKGNQNELESTIKHLSKHPETLQKVQAQTLAHVFDKAAVKDGISPAALNREINNIGWRKLNTILGTENANRLHEVAQVADVLFTHPPRSNINYSNTGSDIANNTSRVLQMFNLGKYIPFVSGASENFGKALMQRQAKGMVNGQMPSLRSQAAPLGLSDRQQQLLDVVDMITRKTSSSTGVGVAREANR